MDTASTEPETAVAPARRGRPAATAADLGRRRAVVERAALACLADKGFVALSVEEIAAAAVVSRRTFYRLFDSKRALFARILQQRALAIGEAVRRVTDASADFAAAVVEGTLETLRRIDGDPIFRSLVEADSGLMIDLIHADSDTAERPLFAATWGGVFRRGRATGELRASLDEGAAAEWLRTMHFLLTLRPDLDEAARREVLVRFVVPSLTLREPVHPAAPRSP